MKNKHNEGFSLVETLIAIAVLALIVIPACSGIIMAFRMNAKSDQLMKAQLAVSSVVETLMAEGIKEGAQTEDFESRFENVTVTVSKGNDSDPYFAVTVTSNIEEEVSITTSIRAVATENPTPESPSDEEGGV